ncbi:MAG: antitoxin VapB family protein [Halobaculum sp.]
MSTTTVRIDEDLLDGIKSRQREGETLSETIGRLTGHRSSADALSDLVGLGDESDADEISERSAEFREAFDRRMGETE